MHVNRVWGTFVRGDKWNETPGYVNLAIDA